VRVRTIYNDGGSHQPFADTVGISCASIYFKVFDDPLGARLGLSARRSIRPGVALPGRRRGVVPQLPVEEYGSGTPPGAAEEPDRLLPELVERLERARSRATFFVLGEVARRLPGEIRRWPRPVTKSPATASSTCAPTCGRRSSWPRTSPVRRRGSKT
jgi:hypothetical protein